MHMFGLAVHRRGVGKNAACPDTGVNTPDTEWRVKIKHGREAGGCMTNAWRWAALYCMQVNAARVIIHPITGGRAAGHHGTMASGHHGVRAPWRHGGRAPLHGTMAPWQHGGRAAGRHGGMAPWHHGTMAAGRQSCRRWSICRDCDVRAWMWVVAAWNRNVVACGLTGTPPCYTRLQRLDAAAASVTSSLHFLQPLFYTHRTASNCVLYSSLFTRR